MKINPINLNYRYNTNSTPHKSYLNQPAKDTVSFAQGYFKQNTPWFNREIKAIEETAEKRMQGCLNYLFDLRYEGMELKQRAEIKGEEVLELYRSKGKGAKNKVEIEGNMMTEYAPDGTTITRRTKFRDDNFKTVKKKRFFFGPEYEKKVNEGPIIIRMIECRPDGKFNIYTDGAYTEGYQKYDDGSETYDKQVVLIEPEDTKGEYRFYSKGYKKDSLDNEFYEASSFKKAGTKKDGSFETIRCFKYDETVFSDGAETASLIYRITSSREECIDKYTKTPNGTEKFKKKTSIMIPKGLHTYIENYTKYPNNKETWKRYYKRNNECCEWQSLVS